LVECLEKENTKTYCRMPQILKERDYTKNPLSKEKKYLPEGQTYDEFPNPENDPDNAEKLKPHSVFFPIDLIYTDTARFQNRTSAFSELSANSVADHYDPNKFDPIVIWKDPKNKTDYVLSGHSRYEGMKRRKEHFIPARYFKGTEAEAITFAKVDANRSANVENLLEDLKAYKLMREGDSKKGIPKAKKSELERIFKGKHNKLEAYSFLSENGLFVEALQNENKSNFPYLETRALWVGDLRKEYADEFTNTFEDDCFNFLYANEGNIKLNKDDFMEIVKKRIAWGEDRLFPECSREGCEKIENLKEKGLNGEAYKELNRIQKDLDELKDRLASSHRIKRVYTEPEKEVLLKQGEMLKKEQSKLRKDLKLAEEAPGLFGFDRFGLEAKDLDFSKVLSNLDRLKITKKDVIEVLNNDFTKINQSKTITYFIGFTKKMIPLIIGLQDSSKYIIEGIEKANEYEIKKIYCYDE
jgi:hypothetical protein